MIASRRAAVTDRLVRLTAALAVVAVVGGAPIISYQHTCDLVRFHGGSGTTALLLSATIAILARGLGRVAQACGGDAFDVSPGLGSRLLGTQLFQDCRVLDRVVTGQQERL